MTLVLLIFAFVFFIVAALYPPFTAPFGLRLVPLGLAFWVFTAILPFLR
jgi:hypothetical protein